jgi:ATP-dependent DNA ligase
VIEVGYDQVTGQRLRHGASFLRWRPDKSPRQCRLDQLQAELRPAAIGELINPAPGE